MSSTTPLRIVDAHAHFWDPARTDWYPYLSGGLNLGMGDVSGMARRFDVATYRAESGPWNVMSWVNVAAATGIHSVAETIDLDRRAELDGHPDAIVGGLPATESVAETIALVDEQLAARRLRGVRPMNPSAPPVPHDDVLRALVERNLVFDLLARPDQLEDAARRLAAHPDLVVVVEHTGWPRSGDDHERAVLGVGVEHEDEAVEREDVIEALDAQEQAREQDEGGHRQRRHGVWPAPDAEAGDRRPQHQSDIEDGVGMAAKASFGDESPRRVATASARDDACRTRHVSSPQSCCRPADRECGRLLHHASAVVPP